MDIREEKGLQIAAVSKITRTGCDWTVPSQGRDGTHYRINLEEQRCSCPDYEHQHAKCKHIYAVEYSLRQEANGDGTVTQTETVRVAKVTKKTYAQDRPAYNAAQTHETEHFVELLHGLCQGILQPPQRMGRPRLPLSDIVFSAVFKVYSIMSGRRTISDLKDCQNKGHLTKTPYYNSTFNYLEDPSLAPLLKALIEESASPLKAVETDFAVDSSGFSTSRFERWYDVKYGKACSKRQWVKVHLMVGVKTNVVTSVEVTDSNANDSPYLPPLVTATTTRFQIEEVSADKQYVSHRNLAVIAATGATPYIPFKVNTTGKGPELWRRLYHFYQFNRETFLQHYHKRSNVETTFSMIKGKFGDAIRSKTDIA